MCDSNEANKQTMLDSLKDDNAYWVKVDGHTWLAMKQGNEFITTEDRWINIDDEDITEICHIPFPEGFTQSCY